MMLKKVFFIIAIITLSSCGSNKIKLEGKQLVNFEQAVYSDYNSGIKSGNSGVNIHLVAKNKEDNIEVLGVYFKQGYANLKFENPNIYSAFIVTSYGEKTKDNFSGTTEVVKSSKPEEMKLPFSLEKNNAVIVCNVKEKKKYFKISLTKKDIGIPQ